MPTQIKRNLEKNEDIDKKKYQNTNGLVTATVTNTKTSGLVKENRL